MAYKPEEIKKIFEIICNRIEEGESLRSVLRSDNMPSSQTFFKWIDSDKDKSKQYARSTSMRADTMFDELIEIADTPMEGEETTTETDGSVKTKRGDMLGHRRLQVDARKWALSKMNPKKYGDKVDLSSGDGSMTPKANIIVNDNKTAEEVSKLINGNDNN